MPIMIPKVALLLSFSVILTGLASPNKPYFTSRAAPFQIRVVDEKTGLGVPHLRVTAENEIVCYTRANGNVAWGEFSLMGRDVRFKIEDDKHQFVSDGATLRVMHGGYVALKVRRRT